MYRCNDPDRAVRGSRSNPFLATAPAPRKRPGMAGALRWRRAAASHVAAGLLVAGAAVPAGAQERTIVSNRIEVSRAEASLHLEFSDGEGLSITFSEGRASVNGQSLGSYAPDGAADREWRGLLSRVLSLSNGPLAEELGRWQPDPEVDVAERNLLAAVSGYFAAALEGAYTDTQIPDEERGHSLLQAMAQSENKEAFVRALDGIDVESLTVLVGQDHVVRAGTQAEGGILLVDGELGVRGRVYGDVIVVDGSLTLASGGLIEGDVRLVDSRLESPGGGVAGDVSDITESMRREALRNAERMRAELRRQLSVAAQESQGSSRFVQQVRQASRFTFDILITFVVVGLLVWLATALARGRVDVVVRAISHQPARSALVGLAGAFATAPAYLVGIAVLVATMLGIPLLIVWVPLFPLVVLAAALVGLVGVSDHVGKWVLRRGYRWLNRGDPAQPSFTYTRLLGLGALFVPWVLGSWLQVLPLTGWVGNLLTAAGTMGFLLAVATGFGAVIMTRGGVRPTRWAVPYDDFGDGEDGGDRW